MTRKNGIEAKYTVFVSVKGDFEQWIVTITNCRDTAADLGVIAWASTDVDGAYEPQGEPYILYNFYAPTRRATARGSPGRAGVPPQRTA